MRRAVAALAPAVVAFALACAPGGTHRADDAAAQGAALRALFHEREHAARLVLWADVREAGPVLGGLGARGDAPDVHAARALAVAAGLPIVRVAAADMEQLFAEHPDGWAAFYAAHPGTAGLVEVAPVTRAGDSAVVTVGRSCGEQCRNAWRVALARGPGGGWRAVEVRVLRVPR